MDWIVLIVLGAVVGLAGGYAGIGGAPFLVAGLVLLLDVEQHTAQGTILAVMLGPMSVLGVMVMWDRVRIMTVEITIGVLAYALFSNLGARLAFAMDTGLLRLAFGMLLLGLGVHYLRPSKAHSASLDLDPEKPTVGDGKLAFTRMNVAVISSGIGVVGGLFGIGAGVLMVPLFISLFRLHKDDARALSLSILLPPVSVGAVIEYQVHAAIDWSAAAVIFVLYFATNYFGATWGRAHAPHVFLKVMGTLLCALGAVLTTMSLITA